MKLLKVEDYFPIDKAKVFAVLPVLFPISSDDLADISDTIDMINLSHVSEIDKAKMLNMLPVVVIKVLDELNELSKAPKLRVNQISSMTDYTIELDIEEGGYIRRVMFRYLYFYGLFSIRPWRSVDLEHWIKMSENKKSEVREFVKLSVLNKGWHIPTEGD